MNYKQLVELNQESEALNLEAKKQAKLAFSSLKIGKINAFLLSLEEAESKYKNLFLVFKKIIRLIEKESLQGPNLLLISQKTKIIINE